MAGNDMFPMSGLKNDFIRVKLDVSILSEGLEISDGCMSGEKTLEVLSQTNSDGGGQSYYVCTDPRSFPGTEPNATCGILKQAKFT